MSLARLISTSSLNEPRNLRRAPLVLALLAATVWTGCPSTNGNPGDDAGADFAMGNPTNPDAGTGPSDLSAPPDLLAPSVCKRLNLPVRPFDATGPYGLTRDSLADDFSVTDQNGTWRLKDQWSGCDSYIFIPDNVPVSPLDMTSMWASDLDALLARADAGGAQNVHFFFISLKSSVNAAQTSLMLLQAQLDAALAQFPDGDVPGSKGWWKARVHFVQQPAGKLTDWVSGAMRQQKIGFAGFGIDRAQRLKGLGNFADVQRFDQALQTANQWPFQNNLAYAAHPAIYFNYEAARQDAFDAQKNVTEIKVYDHEMVGGGQERDVGFPDAATMAKFDTLEFDLTMNCPSASSPEEANGNCGAWDYLAGISFVNTTSDKGPDGGLAPPADSGAPAVDWREAARFITTYHRAGRFTVDATHFLPYLAAGGKQRMSLNVANTYETTLVIRLRASQVNGAGVHPTHATWLYGGGGFDPNYDPSHAAPVSVPIPPTAKRVELRAIITGHGNPGCAEFCDHQHHFTVNGKSHTLDFPEVGDQEGCLKKVNLGAIPNQSGTWWYGRGGWCPGMQVDPWIVDVTKEVTPGQSATVSYEGLLNKKPPMSGQGNIVMSSWIVVWE